jgi:hypothetical protein
MFSIVAASGRIVGDPEVGHKRASGKSREDSPQAGNNAIAGRRLAITLTIGRCTHPGTAIAHS